MRHLLLQLLRFGAVAALVTGLAGLLAEPVSWATGKDFFTGDARAQVAEVSVERCAELSRLHRRQITCAGALVEHQFVELVERGALLTGAALLVLLVLWRLILPARDHGQAVVEAVVLTVTVVAFAAVASAELPAGLAGLSGLAPGAGRGLLRGGLAALAGLVLLGQAVERWKQLAA